MEDSFLSSYHAQNTQIFRARVCNHLNIGYRATHAHIQSAFFNNQINISFVSKEKRAICSKSHVVGALYISHVPTRLCRHARVVFTQHSTFELPWVPEVFFLSLASGEIGRRPSRVGQRPTHRNRARKASATQGTFAHVHIFSSDYS